MHRAAHPSRAEHPTAAGSVKHVSSVVLELGADRIGLATCLRALTSIDSDRFARLESVCVMMSLPCTLSQPLATDQWIQRENPSPSDEHTDT